MRWLGWDSVATTRLLLPSIRAISITQWDLISDSSTLSDQNSNLSEKITSIHTNSLKLLHKNFIHCKTFWNNIWHNKQRAGEDLTYFIKAEPLEKRFSCLSEIGMDDFANCQW